MEEFPFYGAVSSIGRLNAHFPETGSKDPLLPQNFTRHLTDRRKLDFQGDRIREGFIKALYDDEDNGYVARGTHSQKIEQLEREVAELEVALSQVAQGADRDPVLAPNYFADGGSNSSAIIIGINTTAPSAPPSPQTYAITFRVGFDSSVTEQIGATAAFIDQLNTMQQLMNSNGLSNIQLGFELTGVMPTAPSPYNFRTPTPGTLLATQRAQVGAQPGVVPVLITDQSFIGVPLDTIAATLAGGTPRAGIIMNNADMSRDPRILAHEMGHVVGYVRPGGDRTLPGYDHSEEPTNIMFDTVNRTPVGETVIDYVYRVGISNFAVPKR